MSPRSSSASRRSASSTSSRTPMFPAASTRSGTKTREELLNAGIHVMTAVNIQHLETLNDAVARATGVRVRETVPDTFLHRADEVINVDVTVEELRNRLREGKIYQPGESRAGALELLPGEPFDASRAGASRGRRRGEREGRQLPRARRARAGVDPRARDGVYELEHAGAARAEDGSADRGPARREMVRRLRGDPAGEAGRINPATPTRCNRTSGWPRASAPPWCESGRNARQMDSSPSRSARV